MDTDNENKIEFLQMYKWACANCGCIMWMPEAMNDRLRASHSTFFCYNGHGNVYNKKTDIEEIEGKLMNEYSKNAQLEERIKKLKKTFLNRIIKPK